MTTIINDDFTGTVLDTNIWSSWTVPNASVTQSGILELNNFTGNLHSGAGVDSVVTFNKEKTINFSCKWKPHTDHYSSAWTPRITFYKYDETVRSSSYGVINANAFTIWLSLQNDTTQRTQLSIHEINNVSTTSLLNSQAISIDEGVWHDLSIEVDCSTREITVDLDSGTYNFSGTVTESVWNNIGDILRIELTSSDYSKNNTEAFDDVLLLIENYYFEGYVYEEGTPVVRDLFLYRRDTGALTASTTSSGNGYYYIDATYSGTHFIVCLDDDAGIDYNDLIIGNVYPLES